MKRLTYVLAATLMIGGALMGFKAENSKELGRVIRQKGLYVFSDCTPVAEYDVLGSVRPKNKGARVFGMKSVQYESIRNDILSAAKEEYPNADGIILHLYDGGKDEADVIKFK